MELSKYGPEISRLAEQMLAARGCNDPAGLKYSERLLSAAKAENDPELLGYAYYYNAEACFLFSRYDTFRTNLLRGMKYQQAASASDLLARSYNMLAIDAMNQGGTDLGLDYFLKALGLCELCCDDYQAGLIHLNIAMVYILLKSDRIAMQHLRKSAPLIRKSPRQPLCWYNLLSVVCAQGECCLRMGKSDRARKYMDRAGQLVDSGRLASVGRYGLIPYFCFIARLAHTDGDIQRRDKYLELAVDALENSSSVLESFDDVYEIGEFMLEIGRTDLARRVILRIQPAIEASGIVNLRFRLAGFRVRYFRQIRDSDSLFTAALDYFELSQAMDDSRIQSYQYSVEIQTAMDELRRRQTVILEENARLARLAETDQLTGLPNRFALNRRSDAAFERAFKAKSSLGVCIIDIDHFKEFNDTYGHQAGDGCLAMVAEKLSGLSGGDVFCARYGGDEFVVLYEGMTDGEILDTAEKLRAAVSDMRIPHCKNSAAPYVTISQGIRNSVPVEDNRMWDYLFAADNALYHVKEKQKGGILLIHKTKLDSSTFADG